MSTPHSAEPPQPPPQPLGYAMRTPPDVDASHLSILATCHFVWGTLLAVLSCCWVFNVVLGVMMVNGSLQGLVPPNSGVATTGGAVVRTPTPAFDPGAGWVQIIMGAVMSLGGWTVAILTLIVGFWIRRRRRWTFSIVVAALNCVVFPFGTALGVFALIVLLRDSVRARYANLPRAEPTVG